MNDGNPLRARLRRNAIGASFDVQADAGWTGSFDSPPPPLQATFLPQPAFHYVDPAQQGVRAFSSPFVSQPAAPARAKTVFNPVQQGFGVPGPAQAAPAPAPSGVAPAQAPAAVQAVAQSPGVVATASPAALAVRATTPAAATQTIGGFTPMQLAIGVGALVIGGFLVYRLTA